MFTTMCDDANVPSTAQLVRRLQCDREGFDLDKELHRARMHYAAETSEPEATA